MNYLAIAVAAGAAFIQSSLYYTALSGQLRELSAAGTDRPPAWKMLIEVVRSAVLATVLAAAARQVGVDGWADVLRLAVGAWIGFPAMLFVGAVIWENVSWKLAALHAGDWLVKLIVIASIVGLWR
jgi:Protein of unknown function (DUF1761)